MNTLQGFAHTYNCEQVKGAQPPLVQMLIRDLLFPSKFQAHQISEFCNGATQYSVDFHISYIEEKKRAIVTDFEVDMA